MDIKEKFHGTYTGYGQGCRCDRCAAAGKAYAQEYYRRRRDTGVGSLRKPPEHGTINMYTRHKCRCDLCRAASAKRAREARKRARERVAEIKDVPCADCGEKYPPYVMDFDHLPGQSKSFSISRRPDAATARLMEEIEKCEIVCANCHRERTYRRQQYTA